MEDATTGRSAEYRIRVRWGETDPFGIVFYPNFYTWMDQATHEFFRTPTSRFADLFAEAGYALPIVEAACRFTAPAYYDDELVVTSSVVEIRGRSFRIAHVFARGSDDLASGHEIRVFARPHGDDPSRLATAPIPDPLRAFLSGDRPSPV